MGCSFVFDYKTENEEEVLQKIKKEFGGVDCIFDCVGGKKTSFHSELLNQDGSWILYGLLGGIEIEEK